MRQGLCRDWGALDLPNSGLQRLPPGACFCLPHLQELLLEGNQMDWLEGQVFLGLRRLERLDLSNNPLVTLGEAWLAHLPELTTLNLLNTSIMLSPTWDFWGPENLHDLRL